MQADTLCMYLLVGTERDPPMRYVSLRITMMAMERVNWFALKITLVSKQ